MPTSADSLQLQQQLRTALSAITDQQTRDLVAAWAIAWDELAPELRDALTELYAAADAGRVTVSQVLRSRRLQKALALVAARLQALASATTIRVTGDLAAVVDQAGRAQAAVIAAQLPDVQDLVDVEAWSRTDAGAVAAIIQRSTQQITSRRRPLAADTYQAMRREIVRGVLVGANPRVTASRMVRRAQDRFEGGLGRALNIARTETIDAHRAGAAAGQEQHADVLAGWVWLANLSPRTCPACLGMHGREFPLTQAGPEGHQSCRCSRMPKTKSWADLGFEDLDEPDDAVPDADEYFDTLTPLQQRDLLGPRRYAAWLAGEFPRDQWAVRRSVAGWRDSYVAANPRPSTTAPKKTTVPPKSPPPPASPTVAAPPASEFPPMGPVLGTPEQQRYVKAPAAPPVQSRDDSANSTYTFVGDDQDRTTAMLQYIFDTENLVKEAAKAIAAGKPLGRKLHGTMRRFHEAIIDHPWFGVTKTNYSLADLKADVVGAAERLLARDKVALGTVYRGIRVNQILDLTTDDGKRAALAALETTGWWFKSASPERRIADGYARKPGTTPVVLIIHGAEGVPLVSMGRMARAPEVLLSGGFRVASYHEFNGVLYVKGRWEP